MHYIKAILNVELLDELKYSFKVNLLSDELEIMYENFIGGYTTKGIILNDKQHKHLEKLLNIKNFISLVDKKPINNLMLILDPFDWILQCISNDGMPMLEVQSESNNPIMPSSSLINLVKYVTKIGIEPEILEKMRLF